MAKLFIDTHVHIYPDYQVDRLLSSAVRNFKSCSAGNGDGVFVLALTERFECNFFKYHREEQRHGKWKLNYNPETELVCADSLTDKVYILSGRQNVSHEKLEILTLGSDDFRAEGLPAIEIIKGSNETGLVTILPWSLGKWMGKRGKVVKKLIQDNSLDFSVGDPGHRCGCEPRLFQDAREVGRLVLNGSDPLPLSGDEVRAGSYGNAFEFDGEVTRAKVLAAMKTPGEAFGNRVGVLSSLKLQLQLRL